MFDRLLCCILDAPAKLGPVHLAKVDLSDAYMRIWVRPEDLPRLDFVVPPHEGDAKPLTGFHLSLPIGYINSASYSLLRHRDGG